MSWKPATIDWPEQRAVLFVHGVGDTKPGDYDGLVNDFKASIGPDIAASLATYFLYYDDVNDWLSEKTRLASHIRQLKNLLKSINPEIGATVAEFAGDVIFPVLIEASRIIIRDRLLAQVMQMRLDGKRAGIRFADQKISIICHSLGCFHTYEMLHKAAADTDEQLQPITNSMVFDNVVFMASPVQMIRTVAGALGSLIPGKLATLDTKGLFIPFQRIRFFNRVESVKNWVSITGNMDPIGGHVFGKKIDSLYMDVSGQHSIVDDQSFLGIEKKEDWLKLIESAVSGSFGANLPVTDPHSWAGYMNRHNEEIQTWLAE